MSEYARVIEVNGPVTEIGHLRRLSNVATGLAIAAGIIGGGLTVDAYERHHTTAGILGTVLTVAAVGSGFWKMVRADKAIDVLEGQQREFNRITEREFPQSLPNASADSE